MMKRLDCWDMEVIAADLTTPDIREAGFTVVRVLIPQLQPLSQNHNIRFLGTKRLYEVPLRMGYMTKRRDETEITNLPHPFA
jgi:ribosomal protein S12 methylthiotransferase accessory factor